jgi:hypothetical protein
VRQLMRSTSASWIERSMAWLLHRRAVPAWSEAAPPAPLRGHFFVCCAWIARGRTGPARHAVAKRSSLTGRRRPRDLRFRGPQCALDST